MAINPNLAEAIAETSFVARAEGSIPCALQPWGCTGVVAPDRIQVRLRTGESVGLCAAYLRHARIVKEAGAGSEAQQVFSFLVSAFQAANPGRERGSKDPINVWVQDPLPRDENHQELVTATA